MKKVVSVIAAAAMVASLAAVPSFAIARNPAGTCTVKHTIRKASPADVKKDGIIDPFEYDEIKFSYNTDLDGLTPIGTMSDGKTPIYDPMQVCPLMLGCQGNTLVNKVNKVIVAKEDFKVYASWDEVHGFNFAVVVNPTGINKVVQENEQPTDHEITMKDENGKEYTIMAPEDPFIGDGGLMFRVNGGLSRGDFSHSIAKRTNDGAYIDGHYGEHGKVSTPYVPVGETDVVVNYRADGYIVYEWSLPIDRILDAGQSTVGSTFEFATAFVHNDTRNMYSVSLGNRGYLTNSGGSDDWYKDAAMTFSSDRIREACTTHTWGDWGVITEPSCGVDGVETRTCSVCGEIETKTIPAEPHAWSDWEVTTPATCEEDGVATRVCSKCGENETKAITAPGHTEVVDAAVDATCEEAGKTEGKHCSVCDKVIVAQETVEALGHDLGEWVSAGDAVCGQPGTEVRRCSRCDYEETRQVEAVGHAWGDWETTIPATCEEDGVATRVCSKCGENETKAITAPGHTEVVDAAVDATCEATGLTAGKHCSVCDKVIVAQETIPATGHTEVVDAAVDATCEATGLTEGKHCSVCDKVLVAQETIPATGHTEVIDAAIPATYLNPGKTEGKHCSVCDKVLEEQKEIPKLPNPFIDVPNDPTLDDNWYVNSVFWAIDNNITNGTTSTTFEPFTKCSRAHIVTFVWRAAGSPEPESTDDDRFSDISTDFDDPENWYGKAVLWAVEKGITNGTSETTFEPNKSCTRAEAVTFLWRAAGKPAPTSTNNPFTDVPDEISDANWFTAAVLWAREKGITDGTTPTTFEPNTTCSRAHIVTFMYREATASAENE